MAKAGTLPPIAHRRLSRTLLFAALIGGAVVMLMPLAWMLLLTSLKSWAADGNRTPPNKRAAG